MGGCSNHWGKRWPDWGLNPGPSGTAPGALTTELPGLGDTGSAKSLDYKWGPMNVLVPGVDALVRRLSPFLVDALHGPAMSQG
jgi:hypothetical protein